jgi:hypothetical protein
MAANVRTEIDLETKNKLRSDTLDVKIKTSLLRKLFKIQ